MNKYPFRRGKCHFSIQRAEEGMKAASGDPAGWSVYEVITSSLLGHRRLLLGHAATMEEAKTLIYEQATYHRKGFRMK